MKTVEAHLATRQVTQDYPNAEALTLNMGPQHPSTHGVLRLVMDIEGEQVTRHGRLGDDMASLGEQQDQLRLSGDLAFGEEPPDQSAPGRSAHTSPS